MPYRPVTDFAGTVPAGHKEETYRRLRKASLWLLLIGVLAVGVGAVAYITQIGAVQTGVGGEGAMLFATYGMFFGIFGGALVLFASLVVRIVAAIKR